ncbi:guanylate kinase [Metamycoplasma equirhinis]|uniref:Guanylate kinase n=1 Tax=Metamycoplasma equirhinis TaxID=92402 RepID=A0ABZ0PB75_9BACT|nr:guanylate kinase [Metamycoplasma equirhinis]TPD99584.1 guanylate kinase [Metamycoplasma equirhinis]WPB53905.1 guanylate kinase [Metamycoplasma equirhinis]
MPKKLIIFTGPSGVGKGTVEKVLFDNPKLKLKLSVSMTTRSPREGEVDGVHYYFVSKETFTACLKEHKLIEYSLHFDNYYGTLYSEIDRICEQGKIPFLEIETNGAKQIIDFYKKNNKENEICSIFLMPPSFNELEKRIEGRNTETPEVIAQRLKKAEEEIKISEIFQHVVINDSVETTAKRISKIINDNFKEVIAGTKIIEEGRKA